MAGRQGEGHSTASTPSSSSPSSGSSTRREAAGRPAPQPAARASEAARAWRGRRRRPARRRPQQALLLACGPLLALALAQAVLAVNIVYDETAWTKRDWHKYKIDFSLDAAPNPIDDVLKSSPLVRKALAESRLSSVVGPVARKPVSRLDSLWAREDGSLAQAPSEDAVDAAAEAIQCSACHGLASHTWQQLVAAIDTSEPITESSVKDMLEEACEAQVPLKLLNKYRIVQVEAPEVGVSLFVVRDRPAAPAGGRGKAGDAQQQQQQQQQQQLPPAAAAAADGSGGGSAKDGGSKDDGGAAAPPPSGGGDEGSSRAAKLAKAGVHPDATAAEAAAVHKACTDLVLHHAAPMQKQLWAKARDYFNERKALGQKVLTKIKLDEDDPDMYEEPEEGEDAEYDSAAINNIPAHKLIAPQDLCLDLDIMCPFWATQGQCKANPKYMEGTPNKHIGHCRRSCGLCEPNEKWVKHPVAARELAKAVAAASQLVRHAACTASRACLAGSATTPGGAAAVADSGALLPGAVLAKTPGFVLGKPFWGVPQLAPDPTGGLPSPHRAPSEPAEPADEVLVSEGLGHRLASIPGMDHFFIYQLEYKRRVYQYHKGEDGAVTEEHVLGRYDKAATAAAAARDGLRTLSDAGRAWQHQWLLQQQAQKHSGGTAAAAGGGKGAGGEAAAGAGRAGAAAAADGGGAAQGGAAAGSAAADGAAAAGQQQQQQAAAAKGDQEAAQQQAPLPPPMLELMDYLPDTESMLASWWPFMRQLYTEGEACHVAGREVARRVELRAACSPDASLHMLVREPEFCQYVMVLYHPELCHLDRLKPVPVLSGAEGGKKGLQDGGGGGKKGAQDGAKAAAAAADGEAAGGGGRKAAGGGGEGQQAGDAGAEGKPSVKVIVE